MKPVILITGLLCLMAASLQALDAYPRTTICELYTSTS